MDFVPSQVPSRLIVNVDVRPGWSSVFWECDHTCRDVFDSKRMPHFLLFTTSGTVYQTQGNREWKNLWPLRWSPWVRWWLVVNTCKTHRGNFHQLWISTRGCQPPFPLWCCVGPSCSDAFSFSVMFNPHCLPPFLFIALAHNAAPEFCTLAHKMREVAT